MHILGQTPIKRPCPRPAAFHSPNRGMIFSAVVPGNLLGAPVKRRQEIRRILKVKRRLFDIDESPKKKLKIKDEEINFENEVSFVIPIQHLKIFEQKRLVNRSIWALISCTHRIRVVKCSPDLSYFIFEINIVKGRIRHRTTLKLNDEFLDGLKIDWRWRYSNSESFHVGSASFRNWFQKLNGLSLDYP